MTNIMTLPQVRGLTAEQQVRLDAELTARNLTTLAAMRKHPGALVAAFQAVLNLDVQAILAAYGDAEAQAKSAAVDSASLTAINAPPVPKSKATKPALITRKSSAIETVVTEQESK